jgi:hypothetical protein
MSGAGKDGTFPTPRDELAVRVMTLMLELGKAPFNDPRYLAGQSYRIADAMLVAREVK